MAYAASVDISLPQQPGLGLGPAASSLVWEMPVFGLTPAASSLVWGKSSSAELVGVAHSTLAAYQLLRDIGKLSERLQKLCALSPEAALTRNLLHSAETDSGLPSITSPLAHGPVPAGYCHRSYIGTWLPWVGGGHHGPVNGGGARLFPVAAPTGGGKSLTTAFVIYEALAQRTRRLGLMNLDPTAPEITEPTASELAHVVRDAERLAAFLLTLLQRLLTGVVQRFEYLVAVPPTASSPCGVLRLAVPIVPGAPGLGLFIGLTKFVLAA